MMSFVLLYWSLHRGHVAHGDSMKDLQTELKQLKKSHKKSSGKTGDPIYNKWMKFGGGFYGVVAIMTLIVIEWADIKGLWQAGFPGLDNLLSISTLINILVEQFKNFIVAISWPVYWMNEIDSNQEWLWFVAAYAGYSGGTHLARFQAQARSEKNGG